MKTVLLFPLFVLAYQVYPYISRHILLFSLSFCVLCLVHLQLKVTQIETVDELLQLDSYIIQISDEKLHYGFICFCRRLVARISQPS